jgi:hypothetical protein
VSGHQGAASLDRRRRIVSPNFGETSGRRWGRAEKSEAEDLADQDPVIGKRRPRRHERGRRNQPVKTRRWFEGAVARSGDPERRRGENEKRDRDGKQQGSSGIAPRGVPAAIQLISGGSADPLEYIAWWHVSNYGWIAARTTPRINLWSEKTLGRGLHFFRAHRPRNPRKVGGMLLGTYVCAPVRGPRRRKHGLHDAYAATLGLMREAPLELCAEGK